VIDAISGVPMWRITVSSSRRRTPSFRAKRNQGTPGRQAGRRPKVP
jgi:hypothetical protein